jgi:hypothetical protein
MRELQPDPGRMDEALEPVEYAISQDAESFHHVQGTELRLAVSAPSPGVVPSLWIYFTIDDEDYCTLRAVVRAVRPHVMESD